MSRPLQQTDRRIAVPRLDRWTEDAFRVLGRLRGARALHPAGVVTVGELRMDGHGGTGAPFLDTPGRYPVTARLSKATPGALPDALGVALRWPDGPDGDRAADLLFTTTGGWRAAAYRGSRRAARSASPTVT